MTIHEKSRDSVSENNPDQKYNPTQENKQTFASPQEAKQKNSNGVSTLQSRLLTTILPTVLVPLAVAITIGINVINSDKKS